MNAIGLAGSPSILLTHLAFYGLAAICEEAGQRNLRVSWTQGMRPHALIHLAGDAQVLAKLVKRHAEVRHEQNCWIQKDILLRNEPRGLMSPRLTLIDDEGTWRTLQDKRHEVLDLLTVQRAHLDLRMLGALGEPAYWRFKNGKCRQDEAASRLEMQPRNQGSEFVRNKLRKLAGTVACRSVDQIQEGLVGSTVVDEIGHDSTASLSATGLAMPGPVDNVLLWCALWGISQLPISYRTSRRAETAGALWSPVRRREFFYTPIWTDPWHPARLRSVLTNKNLCVVAKALAQRTDEEPDARAEAGWLTGRGVVAIILFEVGTFGSKNAPERRAQPGAVHSLLGGA